MCLNINKNSITLIFRLKTTLKSLKKQTTMKQFKPLVLLLICLAPVFTLTAIAGYDNGKGNCGSNNGNQNGHDGHQVPIDGGITLLLAAGAAVGIKKAWQKNKKDVSHE